FNSRGLKLAALIREAGPDKLLKNKENSPEVQPPGDKQGSSDTPLVIVCHGFTGTKEGRGKALEMGDLIAEMGFDTLLFDFTGCGESEGEWSDISLTHQIGDLGSVTDWCFNRGYRDIILNGRSFGGTTVLCYGAVDSRMKAVCTWAAVASLTDTFNRLLLPGQAAETGDGKIIVQAEEGRFILKKSFFADLKKHDPLKAVSLIAPRSLLLIHGSADEAVPCEDAELLFRAAGEPKEKIIVKGADHRFSGHIHEVWSLFFSWLNSLPVGPGREKGLQ
ncbi:MAG TPA: alpha/beta hydrolase, partial [Firmicutes bacterium]|nr:alpha/beta hydrolase [Bacillota bacterium]